MMCRMAGGNERLVQAMRMVAVEDSAEHRTELYDAMLTGELFVLTPQQPVTTGDVDLSTGDRVDLVTLTDEEGDLLPAFTDEASILRFSEQGGGYLAVPGQALFEMVAGTDIGRVALNPGSPTHGFVQRTEIEALARGRLPVEGGEVVRQATEVLVGRPAEPPPAHVVAALRSAMSAEARAETAWVFLLSQPPTPPQLVVAIAFTDGLPHDAVEAAMHGIVQRAGDTTPDAQGLGFVIADAEWVTRLEGGAGDELYRR